MLLSYDRPNVTITVGDIVADPALGTSVQAGADGLDRVVTWAHASELPAPWEWLDDGILLLTSGGALPAEPAAQVAFVERLLGAGIAALSIGQQRTPPSVSPEMRAAADDLGFPILFTTPDVPFGTLARAVATANEREERTRIATAARLYDRVRAARLARRSGTELLAELGDELACVFTVCENERGGVLLAGGATAPDAVRDELVAVLDERAGLAPAVLRLGAVEETVFAVPVPSKRPASLIAMPTRTRSPELALLQHVATIAALVVEELEAERERRRRLGATLFAQLIDGDAPEGLTAEQLGEHGFGEGASLVVAACAFGPLWTGRGELHHRLADRGIAHLLLRRDGLLFALLPAADGAAQALLDALGGVDDIAVGLSAPFAHVSATAERVRESRWAVEASRARGTMLTRYGESTALFLPRTRAEAEAIVQEVLGDLVAHDAANAMALVPTLRVFLECNRSWQRAAGRLGVHKQTLVYRMQRVEQLTGRKLAETGDVAELWFALRALAMVERVAA
jgi:purine catabolism regulator